MSDPTNTTPMRNMLAVVGDLDGVRNHLRIIQEMLIDQLCECSINDEANVTKVMERLFLLVNQIPEKLKEMENLHDEALSIGRAAS